MKKMLQKIDGPRFQKNYIGKYYSKTEKSSKSYTNIIQQILSKINLIHPRLSLIQKLINKLVIEHDVSI